LFLTPRVAEGPSPMELQHSIGKSVVCEGVGLHTGAAVTMTLHPAPADRGVMFRVGAERRRVPVRPESLVNGHYATTLGRNGVQAASIVLTEERFVRELASARTYGFLKDLELLRQQGLALGGSLENAVVVGQERILNGTLRFRDEFVRHKILDVIGDLALLGR